MATPSARLARTAALRSARKKDSRERRGRALAAIEALEAVGTPVTFAAVAKAGQVSTWLVYAEGVREHVEAARARQADAGPTSVASQATPAGLQTDLAVARSEIRRLRGELDQLRKRFRLHLGAEIEGPDRAQLLARVADLESTNRALLAERAARTAEADLATGRIHELEDELTAVRESLRRLIRSQSRSH